MSKQLSFNRSGANYNQKYFSEAITHKIFETKSGFHEK